MTPIRRVVPLVCALVMLAPAAFAASFVVPSDRELIRRADAIVVATPLASYTQINDEGGIETVTPIRVEEVLKGAGLGDSLTITEPGGEYGGRAQFIPGVPRFATSERTLLMLSHTGADRWAVTEIALGKFSFRPGPNAPLLLRDAGEINGWDPDLTVHRERARDAAKFLQFVRAEGKGGRGTEDYFVAQPAATRSMESNGALVPTPNVAPYTANSYTMTISGSQGARWTVFPNPVSFYSGTTQEPGAPGGGTTAINAAFTSWNNDCLSNVFYSYAGTDNGTHTQGLHATDGANTILFERDLSSWGVAPFTCSGNSYSGTLGIGGITSASGTNSVNGETFATTREADVEMNRGIANCSLLFSNGDWNSAVTHEVGHTLGFRHADQTRDSSAACSSDPSLECATQAIMRSFIPNGLNAALQPWDQHAVQAVYPGNVCAPGGSGCTASAITAQPQSTTISSGGSTTLRVTASGTTPLSYQWYVGSSGNTASPVSGGTGSSLTVSPGSTTSYWVRVSNGCGTADSATATVTVTTGGGGSRVKGDFNGDGRSDILWRNTSTGENYLWYMSGGTKIGTAYTPSVGDFNWVVGGIGDFNGDGHPDIWWRNNSTGQNYIWFMNNNVQSGTGYAPSITDFNWSIVGCGDFNGDGKDDVLWRNRTTGQDFVWYMNGATQTGGAYLPSVTDFNWKAAGVADFNRDGHPDVLWRNTTTGQDYVWLMNGVTMTSSFYLNSVTDFSWNIAAVGDFDGDGFPDLLWRNTNGTDYIWFLNGAGATVRTAYADSVTDFRWIVAGPR